MSVPTTEERQALLAFQLRLTGAYFKKRVFVSTGREAEKLRLLPAITALAERGVHIYATDGTSAFLSRHGIENERVAKIVEGTGVSAEALLKADSFDLVINVLTGDVAYDEQSDARIIRELAAKKGIPLFTDTDVALNVIAKMLRDIERAEQDIRERRARNVQEDFRWRIVEGGGYSNNHAHPDKAYLITPEYIEIGEIDMQRKWDLFAELKRGPQYSYEGIFDRIERVVQSQLGFGTTHLRMMVDADTNVELRAITAALAVKKKYLGRIAMQIGIQPLEGVLKPGPARFFEEACGMADFIGGLPSKDRPTPEKHLDRLMAIAREQGKTVDVHVDQENNPHEDETALLAEKTIEHKMEGRVAAVHAISVACKPESQQDEVIRRMKDAGLRVIICPQAALSMKQLSQYEAPIHNSIAPARRFMDAGIPVFLGSDNIEDPFMPYTTGNMEDEVRTFREACRRYSPSVVAALACNKGLFA